MAFTSTKSQSELGMNVVSRRILLVMLPVLVYAAMCLCVCVRGWHVGGSRYVSLE